MLAILRVADGARKSASALRAAAVIALLACAAALELGDGRRRFDKRGPFEADRGTKIVHVKRPLAGASKL